MVQRFLLKNIKNSKMKGDIGYLILLVICVNSL